MNITTHTDGLRILLNDEPSGWLSIKDKHPAIYFAELTMRLTADDLRVIADHLDPPDTLNVWTEYAVDYRAGYACITEDQAEAEEMVQHMVDAVLVTRLVAADDWHELDRP